MGLLEAVVLQRPVSTHSNSKINYPRSNGNYVDYQITLYHNLADYSGWSQYF